MRNIRIEDAPRPGQAPKRRHGHIITRRHGEVVIPFCQSNIQNRVGKQRLGLAVMRHHGIEAVIVRCHEMELVIGKVKAEESQGRIQC